MSFGSFDADEQIFETIGDTRCRTLFDGLDVMHDRRVTIKLLQLNGAHGPVPLESFHAEVTALAGLNHPHLAALHELYRATDQVFIVLEQVEGDPLDRLIGRCGALPWQSATSLVAQALDGLHHAHLQGIVHRDVRPANLILNLAGDLKLINFGVLRGPATDDPGQPRQSTSKYRAPEQLRGEAIDCRADIYGVGAVLYEILTGRPAFETADDGRLVLTAFRGAPIPPRTLNGKIPARLEAAILKALAESPHDRFQTAHEFRAELHAVLLGEEVRDTGIESPAAAQNLPDTIAAGSKTSRRRVWGGIGSRPAEFFRRIGSRWPRLAGDLGVGATIAVLAAAGIMMVSMPPRPSEFDLPISANPPSPEPVIAAPSPPPVNDAGALADLAEVPDSAPSPMPAAASTPKTAETPAWKPWDGSLPFSDAKPHRAPSLLAAAESPPEIVASIAGSASGGLAATRKSGHRPVNSTYNRRALDGGWKIVTD